MAECIDSSKSIGKDMVIRRGWTNCGALIQEWDRYRVKKKQFEVMQAHEEKDTGQ